MGPSPGSDSPVDQSENSVLDIEKDPSLEQNPRAEPETQLEKNATEPASDGPPDGGAEAWLVVFGGFCAVFSSFGWINCEIRQ